MRIAWFIHRYYPCLGGAETFARAIIRRLVAAGHAVDLFTSNADDLWYFTNRERRRLDGPAESWLDGARIVRFAVRHRPFQKYVGRLLSYTPHWPTRCRVQSYMPILPGIERVRGDYDAVFGVGFPYTIFSYAAYRTARAAGAPLVLTPFLHLATPGDKVNRVYTQPHQYQLLARADTVVVQTELEAKAVEDRGIPRSRIMILGMAVDHEGVTGGDPRSLRDRLGIPDGRAVVGQLGANDPNKGTNDLVLSVARLNARRPADDPIHLVLAGPPSPDFEVFLRSLPAETWRWLTVLGVLQSEDRPEFYAALDLFAMPSRTDSFGIVYLEAWANGLPVIAAEAGGVPDVVRQGETGLLVPFGDIDRLSAAIGGLIDDRDQARRLGQAGRSRISQGFTWDDKYAAILTRTESLIAGRSRARPGRKAG